MADKTEKADASKKKTEFAVPEAKESPAPSTAYPMDEVF